MSQLRRLRCRLRYSTDRFGLGPLGRPGRSRLCQFESDLHPVRRLYRFAPDVTTTAHEAGDSAFEVPKSFLDLSKSGEVGSFGCEIPLLPGRTGSRHEARLDPAPQRNRWFPERSISSAVASSGVTALLVEADLPVAPSVEVKHSAASSRSDRRKESAPVRVCRGYPSPMQGPARPGRFVRRSNPVPARLARIRSHWSCVPGNPSSRCKGRAVGRC